MSTVRAGGSLGSCPHAGCRAAGRGDAPPRRAADRARLDPRPAGPRSPARSGRGSRAIDPADARGGEQSRRPRCRPGRSPPRPRVAVAPAARTAAALPRAWVGERTGGQVGGQPLAVVASSRGRARLRCAVGEGVVPRARRLEQVDGRLRIKTSRRRRAEGGGGRRCRRASSRKRSDVGGHAAEDDGPPGIDAELEGRIRRARAGAVRASPADARPASVHGPSMRPRPCGRVRRPQGRGATYGCRCSRTSEARSGASGRSVERWV